MRIVVTRPPELDVNTLDWGYVGDTLWFARYNRFDYMVRLYTVMPRGTLAEHIPNVLKMPYSGGINLMCFWNARHVPLRSGCRSGSRWPHYGIPCASCRYGRVQPGGAGETGHYVFAGWLPNCGNQASDTILCRVPEAVFRDNVKTAAEYFCRSTHTALRGVGLYENLH